MWGRIRAVASPRTSIPRRRAPSFGRSQAPNYTGDGEPAWNATDGGVYSTQSTLGNLIELAPDSPGVNASILWDGDLLSEVQDHRFNDQNGAYELLAFTVTKWDYETNQAVPLLDSTEISSNNGTKGNAGLIADILGDWREGIIARSSTDNSKVRIYSTTMPCLLEDQAYREGIAWQNVGYNQPANLSHLLSENVVIAQLHVDEQETTDRSVRLHFTPANDGTYGHAITAYEIYRSENGGAYWQSKTVPVKRLKKDSNGNYLYTDQKLKDATEYAYKIAAVVDGKTSFMSRAATIKTNTSVVNKGALQKLYDANQDRRQGAYTNASWSAFTNALAHAKSVLDNPAATQDEVNTAQQNLKAAIAGLRENPPAVPWWMEPLNLLHHILEWILSNL